MKKQLFIVAAIALAFTGKAQITYVSNLEGILLPDYHNSVYNDSTNAAGGFQSGHAFFPSEWHNSSFGGYYSNWALSAFYDSSSAGYTNQYGCAGYKGYNNSNAYAIGTTYSNLTIRLTDSLIGKTVSGFYVNNSTYSYMSMRDGDFAAKKFGDTTGTGCNCAQGTYPDWFKLTVKRYSGGTLQNDSVTFYLADYRFSNSAQDYILKNWTWLNLSSLGNVDSLAFFLHSSDNSSFGMNTPAFFCLDDLTLVDPTGIENYSNEENLVVCPNPATENAEIIFNTVSSEYISLKVIDIGGRELAEQKMNSFAGVNKIKMDLSQFAAGVYYVNLNVNGVISSKKLIKQ